MQLSPEAMAIQIEHDAALASLTPAQTRALHRLQHAKQLTHFQGGTREFQMQKIFEREALERNPPAEAKAA